MKKLQGLDKLQRLTTPCLLEYKKIMDAYRTEMLAYIHEFATEYKLTKQILHMRAQELELDLLFIEEARLKADNSAEINNDGVH